MANTAARSDAPEAGAAPFDAKLGKRKSTSASSLDGDDDSNDGSPHPPQKLTATGKVSASQQLVPVPGNPNAPLVTKRTLQNRKAQREFRKRREARVKDLEERVRRYDEQGIEANLALQQIAESLKQENEALKGLLVRLGFANMIGPTLEGIRGPACSFPPPQHGFPTMDLSMSSWVEAPAVSASMPPNEQALASIAPQPLKPVAARSRIQNPPNLTVRPQFLPAASEGVNPSLLSEAPVKVTKQEDDAGPFNSDWFAQLAQTGHGNDADDDGDHIERVEAQRIAGEGNEALIIPQFNPSQQQPLSKLSCQAKRAQQHPQPQQQQQQEQPPRQQPTSDEPAMANPILSLNLGGGAKSQNGKERAEQTDRLSAKSNDLTPNTALRNFFSDFDGPPSVNNNSNNGNGNGISSGPTGSAMLGGGASHGRNGGLSNPALPPAAGGSNSHFFPMPLPTHQNDALLNPNPIPFAFNLSNPRDPPDQSWWDQMGGGQFTDDDTSLLDEKAQAVAQATAALNTGAQSPFDLSAFLNGGITPGGGFNLGPHAAPGSNEPTSDTGLSGGDISQDKLKGDRQLTPAEHAQMFLRLLEAKMAKQSVNSFTSLGFQPPSQVMHTNEGGLDPSPPSEADRVSPPLTLKLSLSPSLSPINIYSRLSQHPAFLSTGASELEELVDSIGANAPGQAAWQQQQRKAGNGTLLYPPSTAGLTPSLYSPAATAMGKRSSRTMPAGGGGVEVDENAVDKMLGFLDQRAPRDAGATVDFGRSFVL
ncbi:DNA-binding transcription factor yap1 [Thecaphora frezii]